MESDHEELYLQKLRGYIFDEDKVVTCGWLSKTLDIDVISCKQLLALLAKDSRGLKSSDLSITYVLVGTLLEDDLRSVCIVKEDELEEKRKVFKNADESIYSVQKSNTIDLNIISMVDMLDINNPPEKPLVGSVIGKNCIKRNLKVKRALPVLNRAAPTDKSKASHLFTKAPVNKESTGDGKDAGEVNGHKGDADAKNKESNSVKANNKVATKGKINGNQKGNLAALFSRVPPKKESPKQIKAEVSEEDSPQVTEMEVDDDEPEPSKETDGIKKEKFYDSDTGEEAKKIEEGNRKKASMNGDTRKKRTPTKRPRKENKSAERPQKRRKRIIDRNDSDSDEIFGNDTETEDVVDASDDETVYKKAPAPVLAPKNKKRTLVDKTYMDNEGYMITKKEWICESASEDEENQEQNNVKEPAKTVKPKKAEPVKEVSPTKGAKNKNKGKQVSANQPTLMSFFKKK